MKIVLDADVIIHFIQMGCLFRLPRFIPNYQFVVLDKVYNEIINSNQKNVLTRQIEWMKNIALLDTDSEFDGEMMKTYFGLKRLYGEGESACMAYCYHHRDDTVGSNNTKDITEYCEQNEISYLTTSELLHIGVRNGEITEDEARQFIGALRENETCLKPLDMTPNPKYNPYLKNPYLDVVQMS